MKKINLSLLVFYASAIAIIFMFGYLAHRQNVFPTPIIEKAWADLGELLENEKTPWYYKSTSISRNAITHIPGAVAPGLTLVTGISADRNLVVKVIDSNGRDIHRWNVDWFENWPRPDHLPENKLPQSKPGAFVHGIAMLPDGDLVFNFDSKGMVRMDLCSRIRWRLPYRTHHSIFVDENGDIWTAGVIDRDRKMKKYPNYLPEFQDYTVVKISPQGKILSEISVFDLLIENGLQGLLYMATLQEFNTLVSGDTLHVNDVEIFPASLPEGVFKHGDIMLSMRNIHTILVFDPGSRKIRFIRTGATIRQHDPDFIDGNNILVFDNNNLMPYRKTQYRILHDKYLKGQRSRILALSATDGSAREVYAGTPGKPFFTNIMGKQQALPNGNILITDSRNGHALETDRKGEIVWEYYNLVKPGMIGLITEAQRLPVQFDEAFFSRTASTCPAKNATPGGT